MAYGRRLSILVHKNNRDKENATSCRSRHYCAGSCSASILTHMFSKKKKKKRIYLAVLGFATSHLFTQQFTVL